MLEDGKKVALIGGVIAHFAICPWCSPAIRLGGVVPCHFWTAAIFVVDQCRLRPLPNILEYHHSEIAADQKCVGKNNLGCVILVVLVWSIATENVVAKACYVPQCAYWVAWPSGLRRWFKAPVSSEAWVRIPPLP